MIRRSKIWFKNWTEVCISGIRCNFNNIIKVIGLFQSNCAVITIDSVESKCPFLAFVKEQKLEYVCSPSTADCVEISIKVPPSMINSVLEEAINEEPENIFMFDVDDLTNWKEKIHCPSEVLIDKDISSFIIVIAGDEDVISISANNSLFQEIYKKVKALNYK